jgi:hypothetical protein
MKERKESVSRDKDAHAIRPCIQILLSALHRSADGGRLSVIRSTLALPTKRDRGSMLASDRSLVCMFLPAESRCIRGKAEQASICRECVGANGEGNGDS